MVEPSTLSSGPGDAVGGPRRFAAPDLIAGGGRERAPLPRPSPRLLALVALACLALGAAFLLGQRSATRSSRDEVHRVVDAYTAGWNAHDERAVFAAMAAHGTFTEGDQLPEPVVGPVQEEEFAQLLQRLFRAGLSVRTTGPATTVGSGPPYHVSVPQRVHYSVYGFPVDIEGLSLFTLVEQDGHLRVAQHHFWRPYHEPLPSMLWVH